MAHKKENKIFKIPSKTTKLKYWKGREYNNNKWKCQVDFGQ